MGDGTSLLSSAALFRLSVCEGSTLIGCETTATDDHRFGRSDVDQAGIRPDLRTGAKAGCESGSRNNGCRRLFALA